MPPSILLALAFATLYGCLWHVVLGRRLWQWPVYWAAAAGGFAGGWVLGVALGIEWLRLGSIPMAAATLGAAGCLTLAWYFVTPNAARND